MPGVKDQLDTGNLEFMKKIHCLHSKVEKNMAILGKIAVSMLLNVLSEKSLGNSSVDNKRRSKKPRICL